jgi:hypothetical protein
MELPPANRNQFHDGSKSRDASREARGRDVPASFGTFGVRQSSEGNIGGSRRLPHARNASVREKRAPSGARDARGGSHRAGDVPQEEDAPRPRPAVAGHPSITSGTARRARRLSRLFGVSRWSPGTEESRGQRRRSVRLRRRRDAIPTDCFSRIASFGIPSKFFPDCMCERGGGG